MLQNTRVLAVDQIADERAAKADGGKAVTLEVDTVDAQKVWLASSVGSLSLMLRKAGETAETKTRKITLQRSGPTNCSTPTRRDTATVVVTRAAAKQEYTVPVEGRMGPRPRGAEASCRGQGAGLQPIQGRGSVS